MKLILADDDGTVLDTHELTREEFERASHLPLAAAVLLQQLQPGPSNVATLNTGYQPEKRAHTLQDVLDHVKYEAEFEIDMAAEVRHSKAHDDD